MSTDDTPVLESTPASAVNPVRWSGKKTAVAAALALGLSSIGAVGAAAAHERGTTASPQDGRPGGFLGQQFQPGQQGQVPGQPSQPSQPAQPSQPTQPGASTT